MANDVFIQTLPDDPLIEPVIAGLFDEYRRRYGNYFGDQEQDQPQFDPSVDSEVYSRPPYDGRLPFRKSLTTADALCCAPERKIA